MFEKTPLIGEGISHWLRILIIVFIKIILALSIAGGLDEFFLKFAHSFCVYLLMFNEHRYNCVK